MLGLKYSIFHFLFLHFPFCGLLKHFLELHFDLSVYVLSVCLHIAFSVIALGIILHIQNLSQSTGVDIYQFE